MKEEMMYDNVGVYIEPVASSSGFSRFIDSEDFAFDSDEFWAKKWVEKSYMNTFRIV